MIQPDRKNGPLFHNIHELPALRVEEYTLTNGIPVVEVSGAIKDVIKLEIVFKTGRPYEPAKMVSKAVSYLIKEGTTQYSSLEIAEFFDHYGVSFKTVTDLDDCRIVLYCLSKFFDQVLPMIDNLIREATFPQEELNNYISNSIQNLQLDLAKDEFIAYRELTEKLFGEDHPYGYNSTELLYRSLDRSLIQQYYRDSFNASNCEIYLTGKIDTRIRSLLDNTFGSLARERKTVAHIPQPTGQTGICHIATLNGHQTAIRIGRPLFNRSHDDFATMFFLSTLLGGYFGSRLMSNLREDKGYTYSIYAGLDDFIYDGYFYISADVANDSAKDAISQINHEIVRLQNEKIPENEITLLRQYLHGVFLNQLDGPFNQMQVIRNFQSKTGKWTSINRFFERINDINADVLLDAASKYLDPVSMMTVLVGSNPDL